MIKFAKQIVKEIKQDRRNKPINTKGYVTGEAFEKWLRRTEQTINQDINDKR